MPQYTSVGPSNDSQGNSDGIGPSHVNLSPSERRIQQNRESRSNPSNYPHMTLDGRRRPKNRTNGRNHQDGDHWNDWTSTWRKMGTRGHSQPVTMTGTITRGKKKGQVVDVQLDLTDREITEIRSAHESSDDLSRERSVSLPSSGIPQGSGCTCGLRDGPHVLLLSILAFPFILIASLFTSFYFGALTWQNIFTHFYDERTIWHRIFLCPLLVLTFPLFIVTFTIGIALYAAFVQLRWSFLDWKDEVGSLEKGFYGWLCDKLGLEDCCPYTVVELFESNQDGTAVDTENGVEDRTDNNADARVAVVYTERENGHDVAQDRQQRHNRGSLPTSGQGHVPMQRIESAM